MSSEPSKIQAIRFVEDLPSPSDFFETHTRIADAIAASISANPKLRTIGVLGRWGSGKSTVIEQLPSSIKTYPDLQNLRIFTFDAWIHQSEPIRRSYLEVLLDFLIKENLTTKEKWTKEIDILTGRVDETEQIESPGLTRKTKLALLSLIPLPLGLSLLSEDAVANAIGLTTTPVGEIIFAVMAVCFIIPIFVHTFLFIGERKSQDGNKTDPENQIVSIILNRTITSKRTKTLRSPEPTAIEFRQTFDAIMLDLSDSGYRLLCVVDNLDRLPSNEAVQIWAAVRSLFLSKNHDPKNKHPVVAVPMDKQALISVFQSEQTEDKDRAESFIEKTFDIIFRVPPPVMSDWRRFLDAQLTYVLPDRLTLSDKFWVRRLFEAKWKGRNATPTPRSMNRLANAIASVVLERCDEKFDIPIIASFVVNLDRIERDIVQFVGSPDAQALKDIDLAWSDQIAALYYGVSKEKGRQLLLTGPLVEAISTADEGNFDDLIGVPGAGEILEEICRSGLNPTPDDTKFILLTNAARLLDRVSYQDAWYSHSWRSLIGQMASLGEFPPAAEFSTRISPFYKHLTKGEFEAFADEQLRWMGSILSTGKRKETFDEMEAAYQNLITASGGSELGPVPLQGDPANIVVALAFIYYRKNLRDAVEVKAGIGSIIAPLSALLREPDKLMFPPAVLRFLRDRHEDAFEDEDAPDYEAIAREAAAIISEEYSPITATSIQALALLSCLSDEAETVLTDTINAGAVQERLDDALSNSDGKLFRVCAGVLAAYGVVFKAGESAKWQEFLKTEANRLDAIEWIQLLNTDWVDAIWTNWYDSADSKDYAQRLIQIAIQDDLLGDEELEVIVDNLERYVSPLTFPDKARLAEKLGEDEALFEKASKSEITPLFSQFFSFLSKRNELQSRTHVENRLKSLSETEWLAALSGNGQAIIDLVSLSGDRFQLGTQSALFSALCGAASAISSSAPPTKNRWRLLYGILTSRAKRRLLEHILQLASDAKSDPMPALRIFGDEVASLQSFATGTVNTANFITSLMDSDAGRDWLRANGPAVQTGIKRLNKKEKRSLRERIEGMKSDKRGNRAIWAALMLKEWSI